MLTWEGTVQIYEQVMDWWLYLRDGLTLDFIELRYEDAVADFEGQYRRVFNLLGLAWCGVMGLSCSMKKPVVNTSLHPVTPK